MGDRAITGADAGLPSIPGVTLSLDETGDFPFLTVTSTARLDRRTVAACHEAAGDLGAGVKFNCPK